MKRNPGEYRYALTRQSDSGLGPETERNQVASVALYLRREGYPTDTYHLPGDTDMAIRTLAPDSVVRRAARDIGLDAKQLAFVKNPGSKIRARKGDLLVLELHRRTTGIRYSSSESVFYTPAIAAKVDKDGRVAAYVGTPGQKKPTPVTSAERVMVVPNSATWARAAFDSFDWPTIWDSMDEARAAIMPFLPKRNPGRGGARVIFNRLLGGWYVVSGPHQTPLSGRFDSREDALAWLAQRKTTRATVRTPKRNPTRTRARVLSNQAISIRYVHQADGKRYEHVFKKGVTIEFLPDGSARFYRRDGRPLWQDL